MKKTKWFGNISSSALTKSLRQFEQLLERDCSEEEVHSFLSSHSFFLLSLEPFLEFAISKPYFGSEFQPDFALYGRGNFSYWIFVELEKPSHPLFTHKGDPSAKLTHALRQTADWRRWIARNRRYCEESFGGRFMALSTMTIIGRRRSLSENHRERLAQINSENGENSVITYDTVVDSLQQEYNITHFGEVQQRAFSYSEFKSFGGGSLNYPWYDPQ